MSQSINCGVTTCKHNKNGATCSKSSIQVGYCNNNHKPQLALETECASFEAM